MQEQSLQFSSVFRSLKKSPLGPTSQLLYLWLLFDVLDGKLGTIDRTSCMEIASAIHDTKDAVTKQLLELERREYISIDRYRKGGDGQLQHRGDIRIWIFHPNIEVRGPAPRRRIRPDQCVFDFDAAEKETTPLTGRKLEESRI